MWRESRPVPGRGMRLNDVSAATEDVQENERGKKKKEKAAYRPPFGCNPTKIFCLVPTYVFHPHQKK